MHVANFRYQHPDGVIYGYISQQGLRNLELPGPARPSGYVHLLHSAPNVVLGHTLRHAFEAYFAGVRENFAAISLDLSEATPFQRAVWDAARQIPWGEILTYGELAKRLGRPAGAARAVGQALGANPIGIVIPCHRVLPTGGGLGGYAAGLAWKRTLLDLEGNESNLF